MNKALNLITIVGITDEKTIQIGETVLLFGKQVVFVGFLNDMLVFAVKKPKTIDDLQIVLCSIDELKALDESREFLIL